MQRLLLDYEEAVRYVLRIEPDMRTFTFNGYEEAEIVIRKGSRSIVLHSKEIEINEAFAYYKGEKLKAKVSFNTKNETVKLTLPKEVSGMIKLEISFKGTNNDGMYGFYRSSYVVNGKKEYMLTTQFEPADARAAFPCIDEPSAKAVFDLTLVVEKGLDAISNMPAKSVEEHNGKTEFHFMETPRMSTYLLYMGVGRFDYLEDKLGRLKIRVATTPGKRALAGIAIEFAKKAIAYYQKYFGIDYPLPKVDLIAIPDFAAGAMENWGAITFRESALLGDKNSSVADRQRIAEVVMHELAHQWFGDLVTMRWWDDLWLNESFATFMSYKAMDNIYPEWKIGLGYAVEVFGTALGADALRNTHPISVNVNSPAEINSIFDEISYEKGGSILHMLESYVGNSVFRGGLHRYLVAHRFGNAKKDDLWLAIDEEARKRGAAKGAARIMREWIDREGYPVVIERRSGSGFAISQKRFLISGYAGAKPWPIPLSYITDKGIGKMLMQSSTAHIENAKWIKLNYGLASFHRSSYDKDVLSELGAMVKSRSIKGLDAWSLVSDIFAYTRSGLMPLKEYISFVRDYCMNVDYPSNTELISQLNFLSSLSYRRKYFDEVNALRRDFANAIIKKLGLSARKGDSSIDAKLRGAALYAAGISGDKGAVSFASKMFRKGIRNIDADLKSAVYAIVARNGSNKDFDSIVKLYKDESRPDEKVRLLGSLGSFGSAALLRKALAFSNSEYVKLQDSMRIPAVAASNPFSRGILWEWTKGNWRSFMKKYSEGAHMLQRFVINLSYVSDAATRDEIASFFSKRENRRADIERSVRQTLERIDANMRFLEANN